MGNVGHSKRAIIVFFIVTSTIVCFKKSEVKKVMKKIKRGDADWCPAVVFAGRLPVSVTLVLRHCTSTRAASMIVPYGPAWLT